MINKTETLSGYVVDFLTARKWPTAQIFEKARLYPKESLLQGNSIESGFILVQTQSTIQLIDSFSTPLIIDILVSTESEFGIQLRIEREIVNSEMRTILVTEI